MRVSSAFFTNHLRFGNCAMAMFPEIVPIKAPGVLIGLTGAAHSGKDTVANWFVTNRGFKAVSFAGPLKRTISELFDIPLCDLHNPSKKEQVDERWKKSPRELMQWLGTDVIRNQVDEEFFVKQMGWRLEKMVIEEGTDVVVTDVRFNNEAELVRAFPINYILRVDASRRLKQSPLVGKTRSHATESGISDEFVDFTIDNNNIRPALFEQLEKFDANVIRR